MRLKTTLVSLLFLLCPCALCYGQLRFASVGGESGYSAMRAQYTANLDNGWVLIPRYGYYRMSDQDPSDSGSTSRYELETQYELTDTLAVLTNIVLQPKALGYEGFIYEGGARWNPFYYWAGFKHPVLKAKFGQARLRSYVDNQGQTLPTGVFRQVGTQAELATSVDIRTHWNLQATWQKVIKYSSRVPQDVTFSWAEVPYMTAVLQGYMKDSLAARLSYQTDFITPYASLVQYHYEVRRTAATAASIGLHIKLWEVDVTGGIEIFEPRDDENRRTYFSLSVEAPF